MGTCGARVARTRQAVCSTSIARSLAASRLARLAGAAGRLTRSACLLITLGLARGAGEVALRLAGVACALVALGLAGPAGDAGIAAGPEARVSATGASEAGVLKAGSTATAVGPAGRIELRAHANVALRPGRGATETDVEIELVFGAAARLQSAADGARLRDLRVAFDEQTCPAKTAEGRPLRREIFAVHDVFRADLQIPAHVEAQIEQPVALFRTAPQQTGEGCKARGSLTRASHKPCHN
jgi:hypothetical protein